MSDEQCDLLCLDFPHAEQVRVRLTAEPNLASAAERAKALADPSRLRVTLALSTGGEMCVCDLAWVCGFNQNLVSHHLRVLRNAAWRPRGGTASWSCTSSPPPRTPCWKCSWLGTETAGHR
ncbi:ArsR/SmtB family transcription factor [Streptosporangium lutulentum]